MIETPSLAAKTQVFPAAGQRNDTGTIILQGTEVRYWASTPSPTNGYNTVLYTTVGPVRTNTRIAYGHSIRCVRP